MGDDQLRPDIQAASDRMGNRFGAKREIRKLIGYLWEGEQVEHLAGGTYGPGIGLVALTDRRLLFVKDGMMSKATEDFPIEKISSVQWNSGLVQGTLTVFASGNKAEITQIYKDDGKRIADAIRNRLSGPAGTPQPTPEAPAAAPSEDVFETLRKLGELRDLGIVTPEEFEAKKAELLRRI